MDFQLHFVQPFMAWGVLGFNTSSKISPIIMLHSIGNFLFLYQCTPFFCRICRPFLLLNIWSLNSLLFVGFIQEKKFQKHGKIQLFFIFLRVILDCCSMIHFYPEIISVFFQCKVRPNMCSIEQQVISLQHGKQNLFFLVFHVFPPLKGVVQLFFLLSIV